MAQTHNQEDAKHERKRYAQEPSSQKENAIMSSDRQERDAHGINRRHLLMAGAAGIAAAGVGIFPLTPHVAQGETKMAETGNNRQRRVSIITDTAQHLGPHLAKELAQRNHDLVISDPNVVIESVPSSAPNLVNELRSMGGKVEVVDIDDVNKAGAVQKLVDRAQKVFGGFDSAFVRPGVHVTGLFTEATTEQFHESANGNMLSVMYALQALLPPLMTQGSGQVIIEVSATASKDWPTGFLYGATRAGAKYMINNAALIAAKSNVSVNGFGTMFLDYPGFVNSTNAYDPKVEPEIKKLIPQGRYGKPEEAAHLAAALLDGKCNYYTAEFINFCGGWTGA